MPRLPSTVPSLVAAAWLAASPTAAASIAFESAEVHVGAPPLLVLAGDFVAGGGIDLVVFTDDEPSRRVVVTRKDGAWRTVHASDVPPDTAFVDKARGAGVDHLLSFRAGRLAREAARGIPWCSPT